MSKIQGTIIPESKAVETKTVTADGAWTASGLPVIVYNDGSGFKAKLSAFANNSVLVGQQPGITLASAADGATAQVVVRGEVTVASSGTLNEFVTAIASAGTYTTMTFASAAGAYNVYGKKTGATTIVLFGN